MLFLTRSEETSCRSWTPRTLSCCHYGLGGELDIREVSFDEALSTAATGHFRALHSGQHIPQTDTMEVRHQPEVHTVLCQDTSRTCYQGNQYFPTTEALDGFVHSLIVSISE